MNFEQFYYLQESNIKVGDYKYHGFTPEQENEIQQDKHNFHKITDTKEKERIKQKFVDYYQHLVGRNPVLNNINIDQKDYKSLHTPEMDVVHGAISGIPPEDIKDFIEVTKGNGYLNVPKGYKPDLSTLGKYIKLHKETNQSAAIQNNNFGDFPMTTFQAAPETLPIPNSNTANPIKKRKRGYVKPGNRKALPKYNVGRVNMATTMLPYQGNGYSL